jgi:hypothetical protein
MDNDSYLEVAFETAINNRIVKNTICELPNKTNGQHLFKSSKELT